MKRFVGYSYLEAVGSSETDCDVIGFRFDEEFGFDKDRDESFVIRVKDGTVRRLLGGRHWFGRLWRSPARALFVGDVDHTIHFNPAPDEGAPWQSHEMPFVVQGVWGLSDDFVLAWGGVARRKGAMMRWDGSRWHEMPPPPGDPVNLHGCAPDVIVAVGEFGLVARWDGSAWHNFDVPTTRALSAVHVVSPDEMYACGRDRTVLEGSVHGWAQVSHGPGQLLSMVKWKDRVLIAAPDWGLCELVRDRVEIVDPSVRPSRLVAAGDVLLATGNYRILSTRDGKSWSWLGIQPFADAVRDIHPCWVRPKDTYDDASIYPITRFHEGEPR
jgi:hypothetical protein